MNKRLLCFLFIAVLLFSAHPQGVRAAFVVPVAPASTAAAPASPVAAEVQQSTSSVQQASSSIFNGAKRVVHPSLAGLSARGFVDILAIVFGVAGFFYPAFSFAAILFGLIGMGRRNRHRNGMAIAGFVLGVIVALLTIFASFEGFPLY